MTPFLFFCDFESVLAEKVKDGRRAEFARFEQFRSPEAQARIPDPNDQATFLASKLEWACVNQQPHNEWLRFYRELLACRRENIVPRIKNIAPGLAQYEVLGPTAVHVRWEFAQSGSLELISNLGREPIALKSMPRGKLLYTTVENHDPAGDQMPPLSAAWFLNS